MDDNAVLRGTCVLLVEVDLEDRDEHVKALRSAGAQVTRVDTVATIPRSEAFDCCVVHVSVAAEVFSKRSSEIFKAFGACVLLAPDFDPDTYRRVYKLGATPLPEHYLLDSSVLVAAVAQAISNSRVEGTLKRS